MIEQIVKFFGIAPASSAETVVFIFMAFMMAMLVGFLIDATSERAGFGVYGNALVMLSAMAAGLAVYARFFRPLRDVDPVNMLLIAAASAVIGFFVLSWVKTSVARA